jgi:hypothetical protein
VQLVFPIIDKRRLSLPPEAQLPTGLQRDQDFVAGPADRVVEGVANVAGRLERIFWHDDGSRRPIFLRSKRAVANEERRRARGEPEAFLDDGPVTGPYAWNGRGDPI